MRLFLRFVSFVMQLWAALFLLGLAVMIANYDSIKGSRPFAFGCTIASIAGLWFGGRWLWRRNAPTPADAAS